MNIPERETKLVLSYSLLKGVGPVKVKNARAQIQTILTLFPDRPYSVLLEQIAPQYDTMDREQVLNQTENIITVCQEQDIFPIPMTSEFYPDLILELKDPPPLLYVKGNITCLQKSYLTFVGTRKPNLNGLKIASQVSHYFMQKNWRICTGLAEGIDTAAIETHDLKIYSEVAGILGCGLSESALQSLPTVSKHNADQVLKNAGVLISEQPPEHIQDVYSVIKSCRLQGAFGRAVILIQSSMDGGSKFAVKSAANLARPIGIVYPMRKDFENPDYSANVLIIQNSHEGLVTFSDCAKKALPPLIILRSKASYPDFEMYFEPII